MNEQIHVVKISEKEYLVGNNKTSLIDPNIIFVVANGDQTDELANRQSEINHTLINLVEGEINYLIDLNNCGKNSSGARAKWFELAEEENTKKVAIYGMHPVARVLAAFVMKVSKKRNQQFFRTRDEAFQWLNQT